MAPAITALPRASRPSGSHWRIRTNRKFGRTLLAAVVVFWPLCLPAQWLQTIKAVVGHPVPAGINGRLLNAMRFSVDDHRSRSRQIPAARLYADDNDASTAWIDPNPTVGTKLQFQFPGKLPPELNGTPPMASTSSEVIRPLEAFKNYARIKKAKQCSRRFSTDECSVAGIGSRRSGPKRVLTSEAAPQTSKICYRMAIQD